jgi:PAS domain S-box-containing protein
LKEKNSRNSKNIANPHFWVILLLLIVAVLLHYPQQLLGISNPSLFSFLGLTRHAIERVFLLLPVCYAGFIFGLNWGLLTLLLAAVIMIPRIFLISEYFPDALLETVMILLVGLLVNIWIDNSKKERLRRQIILSELDFTQQQLRNSSTDLAVSESKYRDLFENAHDAIWEQNLEGNITNVNQAFETLSGSGRDELLNMNVKSFMDEHSLTLAAQIKRSLYSREQIEQPYEQRLSRKDGTVAILQMATSLVRENGIPAGYLHIAREVTRKEQLNALLNIMEEGIAVIGKDRKIQFMNPSLVKEFGDSAGQYCYKVFHGKDDVCDNCRFASAIHGMTEKREWAAQDGNIFEIVYTPFTNIDQTPGTLATFVDVTKRKKIERELVRLNDLKSEWLDQKTEQLKEISRELAKLEDEKKQFVRFLGIVAHDLK